MTLTWADVQTNDNPSDGAQEAKVDTAQPEAEARDLIAEMIYWTDRREAEGRNTCDMVAYRRVFRRAREFVSKNDAKSDA